MTTFPATRHAQLLKGPGRQRGRPVLFGLQESPKGKSGRRSRVVPIFHANPKVESFASSPTPASGHLARTTNFVFHHDAPQNRRGGKARPNPCLPRASRRFSGLPAPFVMSLRLPTCRPCRSWMAITCTSHHMHSSLVPNPCRAKRDCCDAQTQRPANTRWVTSRHSISSPRWTRQIPLFYAAQSHLINLISPTFTRGRIPPVRRLPP